MVAFFDKEERGLPLKVLDAAKTCALDTFMKDQSQPLPAVTMYAQYDKFIPY